MRAGLKGLPAATSAGTLRCGAQLVRNKNLTGRFSVSVLSSHASRGGASRADQTPGHLALTVMGRKGFNLGLEGIRNIDAGIGRSRVKQPQVVRFKELNAGLPELLWIEVRVA